MTDMSIASTVAVGFFVIWLGILLAGADFPPPIGFLWLVFLDIAAAGLVYVRVPTYINWFDNRKRGRLLRVLLDGLAIGLVFALVTILLPGGGEPSLPPLDLVDHILWFAVVGAVGAANAGFVYCSIHFLKKHKQK